MDKDSFSMPLKGLDNLLGVMNINVQAPQPVQNQQQQAPEKINKPDMYEGLSGDMSEFLEMEAYIKNKAESGQRLSPEEMMQYQYQLNMLKTWKDQYDKYNETIREKNAGGEYAISESGTVLVRDHNGNLREVLIDHITPDITGQILSYGDIAMSRETCKGNRNRELLMKFMREVSSRNLVFNNIREIASKLGKTKIESRSASFANARVSGGSSNVYDVIAEGDDISAMSNEPNKDQLTAAFSNIYKSLSIADQNRIKLMAALDPNMSGYDLNDAAPLAIYEALYGYNDLQYKKEVIKRLNENAGLGKNGKKVSEEDLLEHDFASWTNFVQSATGAVDTEIKWGNYSVTTKAAEFELKNGKGENLSAGENLFEYMSTGLAHGTLNVGEGVYMFGHNLSKDIIKNAYIADASSKVVWIPYNSYLGTWDTDYVRKLGKLGANAKDEAGNDVWGKDLKKFFINPPHSEADIEKFNKKFNELGLPAPYVNSKSSSIEQTWQFKPGEKFDIDRYTKSMFKEGRHYMSFNVFMPKNKLPKDVLNDETSYIKIEDENTDTSNVRSAYEYMIYKGLSNDQIGKDNQFFLKSQDKNAVYTTVYAPIYDHKDLANRLLVNNMSGMGSGIYDYANGKLSSNYTQNAEWFEKNKSQSQDGIRTGNDITNMNFK